MVNTDRRPSRVDAAVHSPPSSIPGAIQGLRDVQTALRRHTYALAGIGVSVESNLALVPKYLDLVFAEFGREPPSSRSFRTYTAIATGEAVVVSIPNSQPMSFKSELRAAEYLQWHMSQTALRRVSERFALHGAGLVPPAPGRGATLLLGPSGSGKSTLTLELTRRGFEFLSDEAVFLSFRDGSVTGFPRAIGLVDGADVVPEVKRYIPPNSLGVRIVRDAVSVETIILLDGFGDQPRLREASALDSLPRLLPQVYPSAPVELIVGALVRLVSSCRVLELRSGSPQSAADLIADLGARRKAA